jgi:hypothetical protein
MTIAKAMNTASGDPELIWIAIQQATLEHRHAELAEIAVSLYSQLDEARAENARLRASLRSALCALSVPGLGACA